MGIMNNNRIITTYSFNLIVNLSKYLNSKYLANVKSKNYKDFPRVPGC